MAPRKPAVPSSALPSASQRCLAGKVRKSNPAGPSTGTCPREARASTDVPDSSQTPSAPEPSKSSDSTNDAKPLALPARDFSPGGIQQFLDSVIQELQSDIEYGIRHRDKASLLELAEVIREIAQIFSSSPEDCTPPDSAPTSSELSSRDDAQGSKPASAPPPTTGALKRRRPLSADGRTLSAGNAGGGGVGEGDQATPAKKRKREKKPSPLEDTIAMIEKQDPIVLGDRRLGHGPAVRKMRDSLTRCRRDTAPGIPPPPTIGERDFAVIGEILLADLFGNQGQKMAMRLVEQCYRGGITAQAVRAAHGAPRLASELAQRNQEQLAGLVQDWAELVETEHALQTRFSQLLHVHRKADLVRRWDRLLHTSKDNYSDMTAFFDKENIPSGRGKKLHARLTSFVCAKLGLSDKMLFHRRIHYWRMNAILVRFFGNGVLAFIPPSSLERKFHTRISGAPVGGTTGVRTKADKFAAAVEFLAQNMPVLRELCDRLAMNVVDPLLRGRALPHTTAARLAAKHDWVSFKATPLADLVAPEERPAGEAEDGQDGRDGNAGGKVSENCNRFLGAGPEALDDRDCPDGDGPAARSWRLPKFRSQGCIGGADTDSSSSRARPAFEAISTAEEKAIKEEDLRI